ncbi:MAG: LacI family DNA-binding transcriptional regulator [Chelatococcus sp.]|jgi:DNA-binding LacI/PurR family transcriptional regulator|uniref:LacI family DNA-binding transcriptional regulator n=1 Tax=unclassified Chelatococcus TaxID=2638111 RepID=UPI001BD14F50|nr:MULTISPECIES: LacI family DNA-binding transcriptional regulator [unclassified Chelatococcus]CAH1651208.1 Transcriptional regulator [Hyphomicrobiales bacterium]MBS7743203.1 LacI family DNA-binding transcriptional regulator [Chelatococcus sp. HY11]MBX3538277.1 LacI family DNA-binding transcriptional regulator [Chelatococcus sp.]MBX3541679.1 LacI family DNA-binding transcriptional regulator [Chelatococcus sp.]MCO5074429.1 LacI family DNA-binding transcriptional regulator [Chelatococcus sp.]
MLNEEPTARRFVSAQQVAELAGVSRSAVSRAFTPGASIAAETREKVMRAAEELGYQVNDLARGLLAHRSRLVGLVVTKPELGFRAHLVAALTRALIRRGNVPFIINTGSSEPEMRAAQTALFGYRAEATVILSGSPPSSFVELARQNGQPLIMIGRSEPDCDHIQIDNAGAAREAARIFAARGLRRLALAGSASGTPSIIERGQAFLGEARRLGAEVMAAQGRDSDYAGGQEAATRLFKTEPPPEAVFCVNDLIAFGLIDAARSQHGLVVPRDLQVIGFDDIPEAAWEAYRLSTFRQDPDEIAGCTIALLDRRLADPLAPPSTTRLKAAFVQRSSTAA